MTTGLVRSVGVPGDTEVYRGIWRGKPVEFERVFRGRRFTEDECRALCNDEMLEIHGFDRGGVKYSVVGSLRETTFTGHATMFTGVSFKVNRTIPYNPEYSFENRVRVRSDGTIMDDMLLDSHGGVHSSDGRSVSSDTFVCDMIRSDKGIDRLSPEADRNGFHRVVEQNDADSLEGGIESDIVAMTNAQFGLRPDGTAVDTEVIIEEPGSVEPSDLSLFSFIARMAQKAASMRADNEDEDR